jgi:hypothetical protein
VLDSYSFEAPGFYQKQGYEVFAVLDDHPRHHRNYYLRKRLMRVARIGHAVPTHLALSMAICFHAPVEDSCVACGSNASRLPCHCQPRDDTLYMRTTRCRCSFPLAGGAPPWLFMTTDRTDVWDAANDHW